MSQERALFRHNEVLGKDYVNKILLLVDLELSSQEKEDGNGMQMKMMSRNQSLWIPYNVNIALKHKWKMGI